jgi:hypothetical protein
VIKKEGPFTNNLKANIFDHHQASTIKLYEKLSDNILDEGNIDPLKQ